MVFLYHFRDRYNHYSDLRRQYEGVWEGCDLASQERYAKKIGSVGGGAHNDVVEAKIHDFFATPERFPKKIDVDMSLFNKRCKEAETQIHDIWPVTDAFMWTGWRMATYVMPSEYALQLCADECRSTVRRSIDHIVPWAGPITTITLVVICVIAYKVIAPLIEVRRIEAVERAKQSAMKELSDQQTRKLILDKFAALKTAEPSMPFRLIDDDDIVSPEKTVL